MTITSTTADRIALRDGIRAIGLGVRLGGANIIDNIDLHIPAGQFTGIVPLTNQRTALQITGKCPLPFVPLGNKPRPNRILQDVLPNSHQLSLITNNMIVTLLLPEFSPTLQQIIRLISRKQLERVHD